MLNNYDNYISITYSLLVVEVETSMLGVQISTDCTFVRPVGLVLLRKLLTYQPTNAYQITPSLEKSADLEVAEHELLILAHNYIFWLHLSMSHPVRIVTIAQSTQNLYKKAKA